MADEDLKLNKLNKLTRFSKSSQRLILREYSNCEVPAGCGGVVFRWKKPNEILAFEMWLYIPGDFKLLIDGNAPESACPLLQRGVHILSLVISNYKSSYRLLMFVGKSGEKGERQFIEYDRSARVLSYPDSSWKYSLNPPKGESWTDLRFDDTTWRSMISRGYLPFDEPDSIPVDSRQFKIKKLWDLGARSLGIEEFTEKPIWIRKLFTL